MTHRSLPLSTRKLLPYILILLFIPLLGCNLLDRITNRSPDPETISLEEALQVTPLDSRPTVMEEMGPPDAFVLKFMELDGQIVRWETWSYFDFTTQFEFVDGELLWTVELEEVPDGSIFAHWYDPAIFQPGMSSGDITELLFEQDLLEIDLASLDLEGSLVLAGDQILLGFENDQLVYVETLILSPDPEGLPLAELGSGPETEGQLAEASPGSILLQDAFETESPQAKPAFEEGFMEYSNIDGEGLLTTQYIQAVMMAYYETPIAKDFVLEVDIRPLGFVKGAKAGVMFRSESPNIESDYYYIISVMPSDQQIRFEAWYEDEFAVWEYQNIPEDLIPKNGIYQMKVDCQGDSIRVYLSDQLAAEFTNSLISDPGYFGLTIVSSRIPETAAFDNLLVIDHP